jgi:hypothetical protein
MTTGGMTTETIFTVTPPEVTNGAMITEAQKTVETTGGEATRTGETIPGNPEIHKYRICRIQKPPFPAVFCFL